MITRPKKNHRMLTANTRKSPRQYPEFIIHSHIADYCAKMFIEGVSMWHTTEISAGGGAEAKSRQAKLKFLGAKKGFPDGMIFYKELTFDTCEIIFIEIKSLIGTLKPEQEEMHRVLENMGFVVKVVRSLDEFKMIVKDYGVPTTECEFIKACLITEKD